MVCTTQRKLMLTKLEESVNEDIMKLVVTMCESGFTSNEDSDDQFNEIEETINDIEDKARALLAIQLRRYLNPRTPVEKAPKISDFLLNRLDQNRFKQQFRMTRACFVKLFDMVSSNPVFHNQSRNPQSAVEEKMMITLKRLGCFGNGASVGMLANFFCVAEGTVELYTNLCLMAIIALQEQLINWPDAESHQDIQEEFKDVGFDGCVGVIDGTLIILQDLPKEDGPDYYN